MTAAARSNSASDVMGRRGKRRIKARYVGGNEGRPVRSIALPLAKVVLLVGQHVPDVDLPAIVMDHGDQPIFVAANVEDRESANLVGMAESSTNLGEVPPVFAPRGLVPGTQGPFGIPVQSPEFSQRPLGNHVHELSSQRWKKATA